MDPLAIRIAAICVLLLLTTVGMHFGTARSGGASLPAGPDNAFNPAADSMYFNNVSFALVTLPIFILMGLWGAAGGISKRFYDGLPVWTGDICGSPGIAKIRGCTASSTVYCSSIVKASAFAKAGLPAMRSHGYDRKTACGITAPADMIDMLIPPSILAVIDGTLTGLSAGKLSRGGIGPGLMLAALMHTHVYFTTRCYPDRIANLLRVRPPSFGKEIPANPLFGHPASF